METTEKKKPNLIQKARKFYAQLRNFGSTIGNKKFKEFKTLEYGNVKPEDVKDIERLKYLRDLDLAQTGYINTDLSKLIDYYKMKEQLVKIDMEVCRVGYIKVKESENIISTIHLGYSEKTKGIKLATSSHENILKWQPLNMSKLVQQISRLHPSNGDSLQFDHSFFHNYVKKSLTDNFQYLVEEYNSIVKTSFYSNKYFQNGITKLSPDILLNIQENIGQSFTFPDAYRGHQIFKLTEGNNNYLVFQPFFEVLPTSNTFHFTHDDIRELHFDASINKISKLKHDLVLGVKEGELFIGIKNDSPKQTQKWCSFKEALESENFPNIVKYYLSKEVIDRKNFYLEEGSIELKNGNLSGYLKKHYGTDQWHFAQTYNGNTKDLSFRPIWDTFGNYIVKNFENDQNKDVALKLANQVIGNTLSKETGTEIKL